MQKKDGSKPEAMISSEFAAMFDLCILPELLKPYVSGPPGEYEEHCRQHAQRLGVHWTEVHYPFFVSMDNCRKHPWARRLMTSPRVSQTERSQLEAEAHEAQLHYGRGELPLGTPPTERTSMADQAVHWQWLQSTEAAHRQALAEFKAQHGCTVAQRYLWELARTRKALRVLHPEAFMPLTPITPDIHQVVENMVGTQKGYVKARMQNPKAGEKLSHAATYQLYIEEGIKMLGNGEVGLHQIRGSCAKQPHTCAIVAADKGVKLVLNHKFESKADRRDRMLKLHERGLLPEGYEPPQERVRSRPLRADTANEHEATGTGGAYPIEPRWQ